VVQYRAAVVGLRIEGLGTKKKGVMVQGLRFRVLGRRIRFPGTGFRI